VYTFLSRVKIKLLLADAFSLPDLGENGMWNQRVKKNKWNQNCFITYVFITVFYLSLARD
jgi:hypothetical protein